jgi:TPR repeat protein
MKSFWKFAVAALCVAAIYGAAISWQKYKAHADEVKLAENSKACHLRAQQGDAAAQADLAEMYYHGEGVQQDYSEALRWYRKAADHENAKGQYGLGLIYYHGHGVTLDLGEALRWYRKSADQGYAKAESGIWPDLFPRTRRAAGLRRGDSLVPQSR